MLKPAGIGLSRSCFARHLMRFLVRLVSISGLSSSLVLASTCAWAADTSAAPAAPVKQPDEQPLDQTPGLDLANFAHWQFESLELADVDRVFHGLIVSEDDNGVDFMEIRRPPGRRMYMVMHWRYPHDKIKLLTRLSEPDRQKLAAKIEEFKNRDQEEEEGLAKIHLDRPGAGGGQQRWHYASPTWLLSDNKSPWLIVDSTADEETTRRSIARIEQVFWAYREILPPRVQPARPLTIQLFGTMAEYYAFVQAQDLRLANPAVFMTARNRLAAGSELSAYVLELAEFRQHSTDVRNQLATRAAGMMQAVATLRQQLTAAGYAPAEVRQAAQSANARMSREIQETERQLQAAERRSLLEFDRVTDHMFKRLFHEAFHAYVENYVYPNGSRDVPRWLNEGLAQIFESGQLESGTLRLDAPDAKNLQALQADLRTLPRLPLAELLAADGSRFLVSHPGGEAASQRYYLYSWGLAYYLAFRQPLLETAALDHYVERAAAAKPPVERFERLVGMPLATFEAQWRNTMLRMKSDGK